MPYENARQLKEDVIFRAGESSFTGVSQWSTKIIDYLNRAYTELGTGASSFLPEYVEDWWWRRVDVAFLIEPVYNTGSVTISSGNVISFSTPPLNASYLGGRIRIFEEGAPPATYVINLHNLGDVNAQLDTNYMGTSGVPYQFQLMQTLYDIPEYVEPNAGANKTILETINSPMICHGVQDRVLGVAPERMDELFPVDRLMPGMPQMFALYEQTAKTSIGPLTASQYSKGRVRFSHAGRVDGKKLRLEASGRAKLTKLADDPSSIPLVPEEWRHVLADMALTYVFLDKNDDRANAAALGERTTLAAMLKENRRKATKINARMGHISPRQDKLMIAKGPLRTESGLIIG